MSDSQNFEIEQEHSKCTKGDQPKDFVPNGQDVFVKNIGNGLNYNCFNRADEDPFKIYEEDTGCLILLQISHTLSQRSFIVKKIQPKVIPSKIICAYFMSIFEF